MIVIAFINAGPALFFERGLPTIAALIEPLVHALTHVDTVVRASSHGEQNEERTHGQQPLSHYRFFNSCFAAFDASLVDDRDVPVHLLPA